MEKLRLRLRSPDREMQRNRPRKGIALSREWRDAIPNAARRARRVEDGRLVPVKRPDAPLNARPKTVVLKHAGDAKLIKFARLDRRSALGRAYRERVDELSAYVGGKPSVIERALIDKAARATLIAQVAWNRIMRNGVFRASGQPTRALRSWERAIKVEREALAALKPPEPEPLGAYITRRRRSDSR